MSEHRDNDDISRAFFEIVDNAYLPGLPSDRATEIDAMTVRERSAVESIRNRIEAVVERVDDAIDTIATDLGANLWLADTFAAQLAALVSLRDSLLESPDDEPW